MRAEKRCSFEPLRSGDSQLSASEPTSPKSDVVLATAQVHQVESGLRNLGQQGYVAVHIRASDNFENTERDFGIPREAYSVASWGRRILELADWLRESDPQRHGAGPVPVLVATDNHDVIRDLERWHQGYSGASGEKIGLHFERCGRRDGSVDADPARRSPLYGHASSVP